jgi:pimeloyl-ACP methyl ester carboxylesterase
MVHEVKTGTIEVNGATLYYECRGSGPALLFISGAEGDAEEYVRVAELLDGEYAVVTYDRRGYSRSPRPAGYTGTSVDEQADDAAALLEALSLRPALIWGNSSGAIIGLNLLLRHPELVEKAMLHEPPLAAGESDPAGVTAFMLEATADGKTPFLRMLTGDPVYEGFSAGYRSRLEADDTWINHEFEQSEYYRPSDEELANVQRPVLVLRGMESPSHFAETTEWLAGRLGAPLIKLPGGHGSHYDLPEELAKVIRDFAAKG